MSAHAFKLSVLGGTCQICGLSETEGDHVPAVQTADGDLYPTEAWRSSTRGRPVRVSGYDLVQHLYRQRAFSEHAFGPGLRTDGLIDHIQKELKEIAAEPTDLMEWIDVVLLGLDGAWRAGYAPQEIANALEEKLAKNEKRTWPDWRTQDPTKGIQHIKE